MTVQYNGEHSIDFVKLEGLETSTVCMNSWDDYFLVPTSKLYIEPPEINLQTVNIPLTNKRIDITSKLPEGAVSGMRKGNWEFIIDHDKWFERFPGINWSYIYHNLFKNIRGNRFEFQLHDYAPMKTYTGRLSVKDYSSEKDYSKIRISYYITGYQSCSSTFLRKQLFRELLKLRLWLWNPFNFETMTVPEAIRIETERRLVEDFGPYDDIPTPGIGYSFEEFNWEGVYYNLCIALRDINQNSSLAKNIQKRLGISSPSYTRSVSSGYEFRYYLTV